MAHDISQDFLKRLALPHYPVMHARLALYPVIRRVRSTLRTLIKRRGVDRSAPSATLTPTFEATQVHYTAEHWSWIEGVFSNEYADALIAHWPSRMYFDPPRMVTKSYDVGFKWNRGGATPEYMAQFPELSAMFTYLSSAVWSERLTAYIGSKVPLTFNSFLANVTYPGSCVIPHKDDPLPGETSPFINMIFFIDGTGGGGSGELALSTDSNQENIFFTPPTMRNACLIYDTEGDFYHGFAPVKYGKTRWVITASFCPDFV